MKRGVIIVFLALVLVSSFIYAVLEIGTQSHEIETRYAQNDSIRGWINISLENEPANSLFEDSYENSITLIDLLKLNNNSDYDCLPADCESDYSANNQEASKTFTLNKNQQKTLGFKFTGASFESVSSFSVNVLSTSSEGTSKQLFIDILNNDEIEWQSYNPSDNFYGEDYGCYESPNEEVLIHNEVYCEKINLPVSPNVEIGAYVIEANQTGESAVFVLSLEGEGNSDSCETTATSSGRISCVLDSGTNKKQDYFICMRTKNSADNFKYKINSETNAPCGYAGTEENERDFEIFVKPGKFSSVGNFALTSDEAKNSGSSTNIEADIIDYIGRYNNDCSQECIIPIKFISEEDDQQITISDVSIFHTVSGTPKETNEIYDLTESPAIINSEFQKLDLDNAGLTISGEFDKQGTYSLSLDSNEIFSEEISFEKAPQIKSLNPKTAIAAYPTEFTLEVEGSESNILSYEWDFGNGDKKTTVENKVTNTYSSVGLFELKIKITDSNNFSLSKTYNINVKTPKDAINFVLKNKFDDLNNVLEKIQTIPEFYQSSLNKILNITEIEDEITSIQQKNSIAQTDNDYVKIMADLVKLDVPKSVFESKSADSIKFLSDEKNIDLEILKEVGKGEYQEDKKDQYTDSIILWNIENIDAAVTFKEFSVEYDDFSERVLNVFELKINEKLEREDFFFIIKDIEDLEFKENYGQRKVLGYNYIKLGVEEETIEFLTTEDVDFKNLPVFISPEIKGLSIVKTGLSLLEENLPSWSLLILIFLFILFIGIIAYVVLQEWYKRKYEDYLFKDKNSLYNLISYIEGVKKKGIKGDEIEKKLKKTGWNSEQVTYIMRKYVGKRTGMFEIPIEWILKIFKKRRGQNIQQKKGNLQNQSREKRIK